MSNDILVKDPMVVHPNHYKSKSGLEAWDVIKEFTSDLTGAEAWGTQQALKYLLRWKHKGGKQDLEKAVVYLTELIKDIEASEGCEDEFAKFMNPPIFTCDGCKYKDGHDLSYCNACSRNLSALTNNPTDCFEAE